ncbi:MULTISPECIES: PTS sugar transporter subunit IIA [Aerococcus]|uniref:PTS sugar transporter subunit IIA n=1 Tax=Aerococcus urinae (strain CCUG 59500 / ACS-120-V-Col10a) TaxID=2976812 RepID=UPI000200E519|nr:fructose PTS transporter subunit IIA [Aerococcus sp. Group 1]AEA01199.1 phosphoenolpyruvate-dependent sugar phosphotransferase system, EIIA 2 [Aerococcus sp. Group 1]MCY3030426.1 fructose PTS transporter subunit IIA [Aerococcus sp. Group 1]MCY3054468.1 fructose PTS transporter subunit IIA [Aerococcus sp. Group 1]MCY3056198.1 fructose PTS transporter subunit IIA [Aerococcus sp. Group 1]MCY3061656.1 fructose PTS transporter subunit IIA [Aerococcus sp. Group 1]
MEIKDILDKRIITTNLQVNTKEEAIYAMSSLLEKANYLSNKDLYIEDVFKREDEGKTGIGNYVAIPHGKSTGVNQIGVAIAINDKEIPWESIDGQGVKIIILFAVGNDTEGAKQHLKVLSLFARKLGNDDIVNCLQEAKNPEDVINIFIKNE